MAHPQIHAGRIYAHPNHGPIRITDGAYLVDGRISNFWHWVVIETGEKQSGYGAPWRDISSQYVTLTIPKAMIPDD